MTRRDTSLNSSSASRVRPDVSVALPVGWQHVGHRESMNALDYAQQPLFDFLHTTARALRRGWTHLAPRRDAPPGGNRVPGGSSPPPRQAGGEQASRLMTGTNSLARRTCRQEYFQ
jgi:hypothetical protein